MKTTAAVQLATALHHSAQPAGLVVEEPEEEVEHEKNDGLPAPKPPLPGKRPGLPPEPRGGQSRSVAWLPQCLSWWWAPLAGGDDVDATTVSFLVGREP